MQTKLVLKPGQNGTKRYLREYGDRLVCVRYKYDEHARMRYKTVEIIVDAQPWKPEDATEARRTEHKPSDRVAVRIGFDETELRQTVKRVGGIWRPRQKLWELSFAQVVELGIGDRVVEAE